MFKRFCVTDLQSKLPVSHQLHTSHHLGLKDKRDDSLKAAVSVLGCQQEANRLGCYCFAVTQTAALAIRFCSEKPFSECGLANPNFFGGIFLADLPTTTTATGKQWPQLPHSPLHRPQSGGRCFNYLFLMAI